MYRSGVSSHLTNAEQNNAGITSAVVDQWKSSLSNNEIAIVNRRCRDLMNTYGYTQQDTEHVHSKLSLQHLTYPIHLTAAAVANPKRAFIMLKGLLNN